MSPSYNYRNEVLKFPFVGLEITCITCTLNWSFAFVGERAPDFHVVVVVQVDADLALVQVNVSFWQKSPIDCTPSSRTKS